MQPAISRKWVSCKYIYSILVSTFFSGPFSSHKFGVCASRFAPLTNGGTLQTSDDASTQDAMTLLSEFEPVPVLAPVQFQEHCISPH